MLIPRRLFDYFPEPNSTGGTESGLRTTAGLLLQEGHPLSVTMGIDVQSCFVIVYLVETTPPRNFNDQPVPFAIERRVAIHIMLQYATHLCF